MKRFLVICFLIALNFINLANADSNGGIDAYMDGSSLKVVSKNLVEGESARLYSASKSNPNADVYGFITFYIENKQIGPPQLVSIIDGKSDGVFLDWTPSFGGYIDIKAVLTTQGINDPDLNNNVAYLNDVFVDFDTDGDNVGNSVDVDDDNDGINDDIEIKNGTDPLSTDTDGDGISDSKDDDNDNDGLIDLVERNKGTNPFDHDTDGDLFNDGVDADPLNPNIGKTKIDEEINNEEALIEKVEEAIPAGETEQTEEKDEDEIIDLEGGNTSGENTNENIENDEANGSQIEPQVLGFQTDKLAGLSLGGFFIPQFYALTLLYLLLALLIYMRFRKELSLSYKKWKQGK